MYNKSLSLTTGKEKDKESAATPVISSQHFKKLKAMVIFNLVNSLK